MRDIAKRANISLGNVYNYFETKEAIFESIINRYLMGVDQKIKDMLGEFDEPLDPQDMRRLGEMIGEMVDQHQDFWLLMYIDVLEFQNRHFRKMFEGLAEKFRRLFEEKFASAIERGDLRSGVDLADLIHGRVYAVFQLFSRRKTFRRQSASRFDRRSGVKLFDENFQLRSFERNKTRAV